MNRNPFVSMVVGSIICLLFFAVCSSTRAMPYEMIRQNASAAFKNGNYKDALDGYRKLTLDVSNDPIKVSKDLSMASDCLRRLNRTDEIDTLSEQAIKIHHDNWRLLFEAAQGYFTGDHYGYIIGGKFHRGRHRGGGRYVDSYERDRVRALQLMDTALKFAAQETDSGELSNFHFTFADMLIGYRNHHKSWRLQYLSDLSILPDYEAGNRYDDERPKGAPVYPDGSPIHYKAPESYRSAKNDGERWRWNLRRAVEINPNAANRERIQVADFYFRQFGVQTLADYAADLWKIESTHNGKSTGLFALHTLSENETIARLAIGVKRFILPEAADYIDLYRKIARNPETGYGEQALNQLARLFENRRQYDKALIYWEKSIKAYGKGNRNYKQKKIDQIVSNWGRFEPVMTHSAGKAATVEYRFRNGTKVFFTAHHIDIKTLLEDVKAYLRSDPSKLDWKKIDIGRIGWRLVEQHETKYIGRQTAAWEISLQPRERHFDKRVTVKTPLKSAGVYLLTARMQGGNTSKIIIWIDDTVIVKKQLEGKTLYFVADATDGKPLSQMNVEFFGYHQKYVKWKKWTDRRYHTLTTTFTENTDQNGQIILNFEDHKERFQWIVTASSKEGRLAYLGFSRVWYSRYDDGEYNRTKAFCMTDRPVYRPDQPVKFKFWIRHARYDQKETSDFAGKSFVVWIKNPKGDKVFEKTFTADMYGGIDGEHLLPEDAALGVYTIHIPRLGGGRFRVEEYKKPEFEVTIEAPSEPVTLGEKICVGIQAKYYFGAPVENAKVKYKVLRSSYSADWHPPGPWDWFYGRGYWWFSHDYKWYPGWREWGCNRPHIPHDPVGSSPPEIVSEAETSIESSGTLKIEIDTAFAKAVHGDTDHRYEIIAEVTDRSRRTIVGKGAVLVSRKPFKVYAWVDRGHFRVGDVIQAEFSARTVENKPVQGKGVLRLFRIRYLDERPVEAIAHTWDLNTDEQGQSKIQIKAAKAGQYRLSYTVTSSKNQTVEGGYLFCVQGTEFDVKQFRFNAIELIPDKREYSSGDTVNLMINTDRPKSTVMLFIRPSNGVYLPPKLIRLSGKSILERIPVTAKDMPNFFLEAFTIADGRLYTDMREIAVPPEKKILNVDVIPSRTAYQPGENARLKIRLTNFYGEPFQGSAVISVYDKSVEYISGGSNVPEIKTFFWKWRRRHHTSGQTSLNRYFYNLAFPNSETMQSLGVFGQMIADEAAFDKTRETERDGRNDKPYLAKEMLLRAAPVPRPAMSPEEKKEPSKEAKEMSQDLSEAESRSDFEAIQPVVRQAFADTAFWIGSLNTGPEGLAEVEFKMPDNLTTWRIKTWVMGHGTVVGEAAAETITAKNLLLRLQAPRFFVEKDEVVLSANIHNYLEQAKAVQAVLEIDGGCLKPIDDVTRQMSIAAGKEVRADFRVQVVREGEAIVRMKALSDQESDAVEMRFPVYVHGMLKTESFCGLIRPAQNESSVSFHVPAQRRVDATRLEIRYSPTLAAALVDALPYLVSYPYGCTEQTLNRFLPTVITQKILKETGVDLKAVKAKRTNLNAQEIGDDLKRAGQWKQRNINPVFDEKVVVDMVKQGLERLNSMQLSDGGWGWFSGWGERAFPHTTAYVVHGLQLAEAAGVSVPPPMLRRGIEWLHNYQTETVQKLINANTRTDPRKMHADNLDALVYMVLADAGFDHADMREFLYRDRNRLSVYAKAMFAMALHKYEQSEKLSMIIKNIEQYLITEPENQTAYLNLPNSGYWWYWYGSEYEAHAYYLKLLALTDPKSEKAAWLVKYLLNNRKHGAYWKSTRDTAVCIEALADYLRASGEDKPDMTVELYLDGRPLKQVGITSQNLFTFDNKLILTGKTVSTGKHTLEIRKNGTGPIYFNAFLTYFTLEDLILKTGLEIKVDRTFYKLRPVEKTVKAVGSQGQVLDQKTEKNVRERISHRADLQSGDLVEIELLIQSKNDYEYLVFEDMKAAGLEPMALRSGYHADDLGAYMELRDEKVCFFVRSLARGKHSLSYRMRAEIPGKFSALPTKGYAMYAPELKTNSDEMKITIVD